MSEEWMNMLIDWYANSPRAKKFNQMVFMDTEGVQKGTPLGVGEMCATVGMPGGDVKTIYPHQLLSTESI